MGTVCRCAGVGQRHPGSGHRCRGNLGSFAAVAIFGAAYMCLSGVLILWARTMWLSTAGAATSVLFIALAVGQALGSAGFGLAQLHVEPTGAFFAAAVFCEIGGALMALRTRSLTARAA